jgi:hypothetical protein
MNIRSASATVRIPVRLDTQLVRRIETWLFISVLAFLVATLLAHSWGRLPSLVRWQVSLAGENNIAAWFSSMLLGCVALVALLCRRVETQCPQIRSIETRSTGARARAAGLAWLFVALVFALLSLDELGSLHERLGNAAILESLVPRVDALAGWVAAFAVPIAVISVVLLGLAWSRYRNVPGVSLLMSLGIILLASVPIQEHLEMTSSAANRFANPWGRPAWQILLEEGSELLGTLFFLAAGLRFAEYTSRSFRAPEGRFSIQIGPGFLAATAVLFTAGLAILQVSAPHFIQLWDGRGIPANWFPAALAIGAALLAVMLADAERERVGGVRAAVLILNVVAGANLALSAGYGADYPIHRLLENREALQSLWMFALSTVALLIGIGAVSISRSHTGELGFVVWTFALMLRPFFGVDQWALLGVAAQVALLVGIYGLLADRTRTTVTIDAVQRHDLFSTGVSRRGAA